MPSAKTNRERSVFFALAMALTRFFAEISAKPSSVIRRLGVERQSRSATLVTSASSPARRPSPCRVPGCRARRATRSAGWPPLSWAGQPRPFGHRSIGPSCTIGVAALGAPLRHGERPLPGRARHLHALDDVRDDVTGAHDQDAVADPHVLAGQILAIVERGARHRHAADLHRGQHRHRRDRPGASHLDDDLLDDGLLAARRELERRSPSAGDARSSSAVPAPPGRRA